MVRPRRCGKLSTHAFVCAKDPGHLELLTRSADAGPYDVDTQDLEEETDNAETKLGRPKPGDEKWGDDGDQWAD
jgi:hypothetical protein